TGTIRPGKPAAVDLRLASRLAPLATLASAVPGTATTDVGGTIAAQLSVQGDWGAQPPPLVSGTVELAVVGVRRQRDRTGLSGLTGAVTVTDGVAQMPATRFQLGGIPVEASGVFRMADRTLTVDGKSTETFGGTVEGRGRIELDDPKHPHFTVDGTARDVALAPFLAARGSRLASHVEGRLAVDA